MNPLKFALLSMLALLLIALFAPMVVRASRRQRPRDGVWPFIVQKPLSRVEQILYYRLVEALPDQIVLAQVPLSRFLRVRKGQTWSEWYNRISQKSVDFLICHRDFTIVAAVELDDASHDSAIRVAADATKNRALAAAQVPLIRWRATALPEQGTIQSVVDEIRRERFERDGVVTAVSAEPALNTSRIDASNDPTMFQTERKQ